MARLRREQRSSSFGPVLLLLHSLHEAFHGLLQVIVLNETVGKRKHALGPAPGCINVQLGVGIVLLTIKRVGGGGRGQMASQMVTKPMDGKPLIWKDSSSHGIPVKQGQVNNPDVCPLMPSPTRNFHLHLKLSEKHKITLLGCSKEWLGNCKSCGSLKRNPQNGQFAP